jgi:transglutaminase-like putative cysteine protease
MKPQRQLPFHRIGLCFPADNLSNSPKTGSNFVFKRLFDHMNTSSEPTPVTSSETNTSVSSQGLAYDRTIRDLLGVLTLWILTLVTAISFCRIFQGWGFLTSYVIVATLAHLTAYALRRWRVAFLASFVTVLLTTYLIASYFQAHDTLTYGLPLKETWSFNWSELSQSWQLLGEAIPPLPLQSGFGFVGLISIGLIAFLSDSFAFRFAGRVESLIPSTIVFIVLSSVGIDRNRTLITGLWIATAIISVAVLRLRYQLTRSSKLFGYRPGHTTIVSATYIASLAIVASLIALVVGPRLPGASEEAWLSSRSGESGPQLDPLVDIRGRLSNPSDEVLFSVAAEFPSYWRITSLPDFDGNKWTVSQDLLNTAGGQLASTASITEVGVATTEVTQLVTIQSLAGNFAPVAERPIQLRSATRSLFYEPESGTLLVSKDGLQQNDIYQVVSAVVVPSSDTLRFSQSSSPPGTQYVQVPENDEIPALRKVVDEIIQGLSGNYEKLLALQSYFRDNFAYSLDVPASTSTSATLDFLARQSGYCEQFSSTFALFARLIGLPSRVVIGFTPGEETPIGTSNVRLFNVRSQHAHAWPEVWFDGIGWVLFEPTPGRGAPSADYTNVDPAQDNSLPVPAASTTTTPDPISTTTVVAPTTTPSGPDTSIAPNTGAGTDTTAPWLKILVVVLALVALWAIALPIVIRSLVQRRESNEILINWRIAVAQFETVHGRLPKQFTVYEIGQTFIAKQWDDPQVMTELVDDMSKLLFAPHLVDPIAAEALVAFVKSHNAQLPLKVQVLRRISPRLAWKLAGGTPA